MKKTLKNSLAVLLAILLMCSGLPMTGLAASTLRPIQGIIEGSSSNYTWQINLNTGVVTFTGEGKIYHPPFDYDAYIEGYGTLGDCVKRITFSEGITETHYVITHTCAALSRIDLPSSLEVFDEMIGDLRKNPGFRIYVPASNPNLTLDAYGVLYADGGKELVFAPDPIPAAYTIPSSVELIRQYAFYGDESLRSIVIPDSVKTIESHAFACCSNVESLTLGRCVETIDDQAFGHLEKVTHVYIPAAVKDLAFHAFDSMLAVQAFEVDPANPNYMSVDGVLIEKQTGWLVQYPAGSPASSYTVPQGVRSIITLSFAYAHNLESVTLAPTVQNVGFWAFFNCGNLTQVVIPDGVYAIDHEAFAFCSKIRSLEIPGSMDTFTRMISEAAALESVILHSGVRTIDTGSYAGSPALKTVHIPSTVTQINDAAFTGASCTICSDSEDCYAMQFAREHGIPTAPCTHEPLCDAHDFAQSDSRAATCTEAGFTRCTCRNCGFSYKETIEAPGHDYASWTFTPDYHKGTCLRCGETKKSSHTLVRTSQEATCTDEGWIKYTCTVCDYGTTTVIPAYTTNGQHRLVRRDIQSAACTESGTARMVCSRCNGYESEEFTVPALGHAIKIRKTEPTCTEDGAADKYCTRCDYTETETLPALGHDWFDWEITTPAEAGLPGEMTRSCRRCGLVQTDPIEPLVPMQPEDEATAEELAALHDAIALLPDPENLRFYKDEAILRVAAALGHTGADADAFLQSTCANGYVYEGDATSEAVRSAAEALRVLTAKGDRATAASLFAWTQDDTGRKTLAARDESKANAAVQVVPVAVNGVPVEDGADVSVCAGDRITYALRLETDYYVSAADFPVVFDAQHFYLVDQSGDRYGYDEDDSGAARSAYDLIADEMISTRGVAEPVSRNYFVECYTVDSPETQYPSAFRTPEFMQQYKIMLIELMTKLSRQTKPQIFSAENRLLCTFTLEAREGAKLEGTEAMVCVPEDWYATNANPDALFSVTRAAGLRADGVTPALGGTNAGFCFEIFDRDAQYGQTMHSIGAAVSFRSPCPHEFVVSESCDATDVRDGYCVFVCTKCGTQYTEVIPAAGPTLELSAPASVCDNELDVQIRIRNNPGIVATRVWIEYDSEALELQGAENGEIFGDECILLCGLQSANPYIIMWEDPLTHENYLTDGVLATLHFKVRPDAPLGNTPIRLFYDAGSTFDTNLTDRPFNVRSTHVNITRLRGDADGDGKLTLKDIAMMRRFMVSSLSETAMPLSLDYNGDGRVNAKDSTLLTRHIAGGWDA